MFYYLLSFIIVAIDQASKALVEKKVKPGEEIELVSGKLIITNIKNSGAAYGLLKDNAKALSIFTIFSSVNIIRTIAQIIKAEEKTSAYKFALASMMGGAVGNIINRVKDKQVTDFIILKPFAKSKKGCASKNYTVFNIADVFIVLGASVFLGKASLDKYRD